MHGKTSRTWGLFPAAPQATGRRLRRVAFSGNPLPMLEKLPHIIGQHLRGKGPGLDKTMYFAPAFADIPEAIQLTSPALTDAEAIPARYTEDGEKLSPPLAWASVPAGTDTVLRVVEDADSPTPAPIVHALVLDLPAQDGRLEEGELRVSRSEGGTRTLGKNTFLKTAYLPPDPPPGGGTHRYVFQVYALDQPTGLAEGAGRAAVRDAIRGHVLARGCFVATYERA